MGARRGFSLIELLVVIAIIALLISLLLPALGKAREAGKATVCLSHMQQFGIAMGGYLIDSKGYFPGDHRQINGSWITWAPRLRRYMQDNTDSFYCPSARAEYKWKPVFNYTGSGDPTKYGYLPRERPLNGHEFFCYGYNGWGTQEWATPQLGLGGHVAPMERGVVNTEPQWAELHESKVRQPSNMIAIADSLSDGTWDTTISPTGGSYLPSRRHTKSSQVLFADSHARAMLYTDLVSNRPEDRARWNNDHKPH